MMTRIKSSRSTECNERLFLLGQNTICYRALLLFVIAALLWIYQQSTSVSDKHHIDDEYLFHRAISPHRCLDADDPPSFEPEQCHCADPLRPVMRPGDWEVHHQNMVKDAENAPRHLDVALIGDSITERWNGTKRTGTIPAPEFRQVFEKYFSKAAGAQLDGLALGSSGDITSELLWHLQNGMLPDALEPKVFVLLIGTNDLGRSYCSKRTTLAGILNVANYLRSKRPGVPIILHALMPRSDVFGALDTDYSLGKHWSNIMWINRELKQVCSLHSEWYYLDVNHIFLERKKEEGKDFQGALSIIPSLMEDALHPTVEGYEAWGPLLVKKILELINEER